MIGVGIDLVDIERFRRSLERTPTMRARLFTEIELAYVAAKSDPVPSLAARFAAREAVMKAPAGSLAVRINSPSWNAAEASTTPATPPMPLA